MTAVSDGFFFDEELANEDENPKIHMKREVVELNNGAVGQRRKSAAEMRVVLPGGWPVCLWPAQWQDGRSI